MSVEREGSFGNTARRGQAADLLVRCGGRPIDDRDSALSPQVEGRAAERVKSASIGYIHTFPIPYCRTPLGQADHSHVNAKPSWQGLHHNRVSLIPYSTRFRQLQLPERLHHRVAHARVRVIEPRNEGGAVLRERRRLQLSGRLHRRLATVLVRVLEPRNEGGGA